MFEKSNEDAYDTKRLWNDIKDDPIVDEIYPNLKVLIGLLMLFPLSAAVVERLFSKLKIVKNRLRNRLGDVTLSKLLTLCTESPKGGFTEHEFECMVDTLKMENPSMRAKDKL